jgi:hypothetical protein
MKRIARWMLVALVAVPAALGQRNVREDASAPVALVTLSDASRWQVGLTYGRLSRPVELDGSEWRLRGDVVDVFLGYSPAPWLMLYGQAGGSQARLDGLLREEPATGAGGLLGARANLWQLHEGVRVTSWRFTIQLDGQVAYRTTDDEGDGELRWSEVLVMLPLDYHLTFARSFRNFYMAEFHSVRIYAGPAYSKLDGTWERLGETRDFEESEAFGVVAGAELWLLENLSFGVRAEWFDATTAQLSLRYRF